MSYAGNKLPPRKSSQIKKLSRNFLLSDGRRERSSKMVGITSTYYIKDDSALAIGYVHNNAANTLFSDCHAEQVGKSGRAPFAYKNQKLPSGDAGTLTSGEWLID